ncbi:MAG: right-handed parallel beta-helix repeat-containing protein [Methanobacteriaceae archaeon]|nr:right-handed parallel beta-helix repeat-containing protein [Methanobacteriaceae archaeon]
MINSKSIRVSFILIMLAMLCIGLNTVSATDDINAADLNLADNIEYTNSVIHITEENYSDYFDSNGNLNNSLVLTNDTIDLSGNFNNKSFIFNKPLKITSSNKDAYLYNCQLAFVNVTADLGNSIVSNLNMNSTITQKILILVENSENVFVLDNILTSSGYHSYPIALETSNYITVSNNTIKTTVSNREEINSGNVHLDDLNKDGSDNSSWQHSGITLRGSHYNLIENNDITVEDSYGIYFCYPLSNYNDVLNNTIKCSIDHPSFWAYGIYITGGNNSISNNTIIGMYRGISVTKSDNIISGNKIYNITGIDLSNTDIIGGDYAIYSSEHTIIANNSIYNANIFKAGIIVSANCEVYGNYIEIATNQTGIKIGGEEGGSNSRIYNNTINFLSGFGILVDGNPENVYIGFNNLSSNSCLVSEDINGLGEGQGIGIYVKYQSKSKRPYGLTVEFNNILTSSNIAIDISQSSLELWYCENNEVYGKIILYPNATEYVPTEREGNTYYVSPSNFNEFFDSNGELSNIVDDYDTLIFTGDFAPKSHKLILSKLVNIVGNNGRFINTTICVYVSGCTIENITIDNNGTKVSNLWGIYVYEANNIKIVGNNISVWDKNTSYAIYLSDSVGSNISNNILKAQGDELTFTLLSYEVYDCLFENNNITAIGTGILHPYIQTICFDGVHSISELSKTYGVIFDFSSNNRFVHNDINVTSLVEGFQVPYNPSVNILIGLYLYYDSDYNNISENNVWVEGHDPFLYGIGCSGDDTSKSVTTADYNIFKDNNVTVKGDYFSTGLILRHNSINTLVDGNSINLNAINYTYGITLELSGFSNVVNNKMNNSAHGNYGIELYSSWSNNIDSNILYSDASFTESVGAYGSSGNNFTRNKMVSLGDSRFDPAQGPEHPDSVFLKNVAMWFDSRSSGNRIEGNSIYTDAPYGIEFAGGSTGNYVGNNNICAGQSYGNVAILDNVGGNTVSNNKGKIFSENGSSDYQNDVILSDSDVNGASGNGAIDYGLEANALSSAGTGSGDVSSSNPNAYELNQASMAAKSGSSQYVVPLIILFIIALFCYSFLNERKEE